MDRATLARIYEIAATIRAADERLRSYMNQGRYRGIHYSPRGQEVLAAVIGVCLDPDDYLVTTYRGFHDQIAKGVPLREILAEMYGKRTGTSKGKGGPMHITAPDQGLLVTTGIVGAGIPIGAGIALGAKLQQTGRVCLTSFGDGATNIGAFHEGLNLAAVWDLPVVFVCQNNEYAEFTPRVETQRVEIADRAASYGMAGVAVDGNDAEAMHDVLSEAVTRARSGGGPTLLDCRTFRFMGHFYGDPQVYMDKEELARRMNDDPVDRLRFVVNEAGVPQTELEELEARIERDIDAAVEFAESSPEPDPTELHDDLYARAAR